MIGILSEKFDNIILHVNLLMTKENEIEISGNEIFIEIKFRMRNDETFDAYIPF